ncbi:unnamed protein product, partial [Echinostoma caproni]|uniref:Sodium channel protein para n=1 Tax=Echinostoma caproni TaxID=27848 RepID=A0A183A4R6_9TREM
GGGGGGSGGWSGRRDRGSDSVGASAAVTDGTDHTCTGAQLIANDNPDLTTTTTTTPVERTHHPTTASSHTTSRRTTGSRAEDLHSDMKPPGFGVTAFTAPTGMTEPQTAQQTQPPAPIDPLDLVIAKRKKKELADPVIAEAIMTACKLPPPPIPETENLHEVPEELQQLMSFGFARHTTDEKDLEFLRNYPLHQKPREPLKVPTVSQMSRYETFRKKYWSAAFRRHRDQEEDDEKHAPVDVGYVDGDTGTGPALGGTRKDFFPISVHTDEDWFMESVLHVMCILLIVLTLPLSLIFCLKVSLRVVPF